MFLEQSCSPGARRNSIFSQTRCAQHCPLARSKAGAEARAGLDLVSGAGIPLAPSLRAWEEWAPSPPLLSSPLVSFPTSPRALAPWTELLLCTQHSRSDPRPLTAPQARLGITPGCRARHVAAPTPWSLPRREPTTRSQCTLPSPTSSTTPRSSSPTAFPLPSTRPLSPLPGPTAWPWAWWPAPPWRCQQVRAASVRFCPPGTLDNLECSLGVDCRPM